MHTVRVKSETIYSFDGTPLYYEVRGAGEPLILVYGIGCLMNHWHHQVEYFSRHYQVITYDLRGHHKSQPLVDIRNLKIKNLAQDIEALMDHLEIEKAHFMGHSFGAPTILEFYDLLPHRVHSMIFINGFSKNPIKGMFGLDVVEPFYRFVKAQHDIHPELWKTLWRSAIDNPLAMYFAGLAGGFNLKLTEFKDIEVYARGIARMDLHIFLRLFEELMDFNGDLILPKITAPTLVISGEKDNVTPQRFQMEFKNAIPHSEFVLVPYGSHCTQLDYPDYVNLRIEKFLESHGH